MHVIPVKPRKLRSAFVHNVFQQVIPDGLIIFGLSLDVLVPDSLFVYSVEENAIDLLRLVIKVLWAEIVVLVSLLVFPWACGKVECDVSTIFDIDRAARCKATEGSICIKD